LRKTVISYYFCIEFYSTISAPGKTDRFVLHTLNRIVDFTKMAKFCVIELPSGFFIFSLPKLPQDSTTQQCDEKI